MLYENRALVIFSGGQDSTSCLHFACTQHSRVSAITFDYGQRHAAEVSAARKITGMYKVPHEVINVKGIFVSESPLVNDERSVEQYDSKEALPGGIENTFVEGRNMVFMAIAANRAAAVNAGVIYIGVSQEDFGGYPDCRQHFLTAMERAMRLALGFDINSMELRVLAPLLFKSKASTALWADELPLYKGMRQRHFSLESHVLPRYDSTVWPLPRVRAATEWI